MLLVQHLEDILCCQGRAKGVECQGNAKTKDSKEKKSERTMECFVTSFRIPSIVTDAFSSENEGGTREPKSVSFEPDGTSVIMDNSANCHIFRDKALFKDGIKSFPVSIQHLKVRTANGSTAPAGIGTVEITICDDEGKNHKLKLENALYFPESPVNVLGVTSLAAQLDDDDGTYIKTFRKNSIFVCDNESWQRNFEHPPSGLPELSVNEGFSTLTALYEAFASVIPMAKATLHCFASEQQLHPSHLSMAYLHSLKPRTLCSLKKMERLPLSEDRHQPAMVRPSRQSLHTLLQPRECKHGLKAASNAVLLTSSAHSVDSSPAPLDSSVYLTPRAECCCYPASLDLVHREVNHPGHQ